MFEAISTTPNSRVLSLKEKEKLRNRGKQVKSILSYPLFLTLSQTTNFRLFQTEIVCKQQFKI